MAVLKAIERKSNKEFQVIRAEDGYVIYTMTGIQYKSLGSRAFRSCFKLTGDVILRNTI